MRDRHFLRIVGTPVPKGRPRATSRGGFVRVFTPKLTADAEAVVRRAGELEFGETGPLEGPIRMTVFFYMPVPKSTSRKKAEALYGKPHVKRPDIDNMLKLVQDALNGVAYLDDSQLAEVRCFKTYVKTPRTDVTIERL